MVIDNSSRRHGGGIYTRLGAVTISHSEVRDNSSSSTYTEGGGVYTRSGDVTVITSTISGTLRAVNRAAAASILTWGGVALRQHGQRKLERP